MPARQKDASLAGSATSSRRGTEPTPTTLPALSSRSPQATVIACPAATSPSRTASMTCRTGSTRSSATICTRCDCAQAADGTGIARAGGLDVLVDAEDVVGVVAALDLSEPVVVAAVGGLDPVLALVHQEVDVSPAD